MAGFNFGAFAGGVGSGIEQGQNIRERYKKLSDENVARRAQQDVDNWLQGGGQGPSPSLNTPGASPGAPGMTAPPANLGGLQPVAMPGAQPMPQPGGAPPPGGPPGPPPPAPGMQPQPGSPAPLGASPPPVAPPIPGSAGGGGAPPPQPGGGAPSPNPQAGDGAPPDPSAAPSLQQQTQEAKTALQAVARQIAQANPGRHWQPGELLDAVDNVIGQMDKLNPQAKILAQAQIAGARAQHDYYLQAMKNEQSGANVAARDATSTANTDTRVAATERGQDLSHEDRQAGIKAGLQRTAMTVSSAERRTAMQDATRLQAEAIIQAGANGRTQEVVDQRQAALEAGLNEKDWQTEITAQLKEQGMSDTFIASLFRSQASAAAQSGQGAPSAPTAATERPLPAPPARGGGAATAGTQQNPARPRSREEAAKLPKGTWFMDPSGNVIQKH